jgi:hypothetical protein
LGIDRVRIKYGVWFLFHLMLFIGPVPAGSRSRAAGRRLFPSIIRAGGRRGRTRPACGRPGINRGFRRGRRRLTPRAGRGAPIFRARPQTYLVDGERRQVSSPAAAQQSRQQQAMQPQAAQPGPELAGVCRQSHG